MDNKRLLLDLEQLPPFVAFLEHIKTRSSEQLANACYEAQKGNAEKSASHLLTHLELKDLWTNFRNSYEN